MGGGRWVGLARGLRGVLVLIMLLGCAPQGETPVTQGPLLGSWVFTANPYCQQTLNLSAEGWFTYSTEVRAPLGRRKATLTGSFTYSPGEGIQEGWSLALAPDRSPWPGEWHYCSQQDEYTTADLPFAKVAQAKGFDPSLLRYRPLHLPSGSTVLVGADATLTDRFVLESGKEGLLRGWTLDGLAPPGRVLTSLPLGDPGTQLDFLGLAEVLLLPHRGFHELIPLTAGITGIRRLLLNITGPLEVTFTLSAGKITDNCQFLVYSDTGYQNLVNPNPLAAQGSQTLFLDPGSPPSYLLKMGFTDSLGAAATTWLMPLKIQGSGSGSCTVTITGQTLTTGLVLQHQITPVTADLFSLPVPSGGGFLTFRSPGQQEAWDRLSIRTLPVIPEGIELGSRVFMAPPELSVNPASPAEDSLNVFGHASGPTQVLVEGSGEKARMTLFAPEFPGAGQGPWLRPVLPTEMPQAQVPSVETLNLPATNQPLWRSFQLTAPGRVAVFSSGGARVSGSLYNGEGVRVGQNAGGAADGAGFYLERSLKAGAYRLKLEGLPGASASLHVEFAPMGPYTSEAVLDCLVGSGLKRASPGSLQRLECPNQNLVTLEGLTQITGLYSADLRWNLLRDLTPLRAPFLRVLLLDGNPLESLTPLETLTGLVHLSLAHTRLDPAWLPSLLTLGGRLAELDLNQSTGWAAAELRALRAAFPLARIVDPEGNVMP